MSDLISRSDVLDLLYGIFDKYKMSTDKNTSIGKSFGTDVFEEIRNMPTSYSVDNVVEELESFAKLAEDRWTNGTSKHAYQEHKCWVKAIEIVKHGVVTDDV